MEKRGWKWEKGDRRVHGIGSKWARLPGVMTGRFIDVVRAIDIKAIGK